MSPIVDHRFIKGALAMCATLFIALLIGWPIYGWLHG